MSEKYTFFFLRSTFADDREAEGIRKNTTRKKPKHSGVRKD